MRTRAMFVTAVVSLCSAGFGQAAGSAQETAQEEKTFQGLTWIRHFEVHAGLSSQFQEFIMEHDAPIFNSLIEEGDAKTWGLIRPVTHTGQEWTHAIWITVDSWENYDTMMERFEDKYADMGTERAADMEREFLDMVDPKSVRDVVLRHAVFIDTPNEEDYEPAKFLRFTYLRANPGHDLLEFYNELAAPVYKELEEEGTVLAAGFATQELVTDSEWTHLAWVALPSLASMDELGKAFMKADKERGEAYAEWIQNAAENAIEDKSYRSTILEVTHMRSFKE